MIFNRSYYRKFFAPCLMGSAVFFIFLTSVEAVTKPVTLALKRKKAIVSIQSTSHSEAPGNGFAKLVAARMGRPVNYVREGSGVIIDPRGVIVTNAHTVQNATTISVVFIDGTKVSGELVGLLPEGDLAFISVRPPFALSYVPLADSSKVSVGTQVFAIGRAMNHEGAVFGGKISGMALDPRRGASAPAFLMAVFGFHFYSGDSGSPVLNQKGDLVGLLSGGRRDGDKAAVAVPSNFIRDAYGSLVVR